MNNGKVLFTRKSDINDNPNSDERSLTHFMSVIVLILDL